MDSGRQHELRSLLLCLEIEGENFGYLEAKGGSLRGLQAEKMDAIIMRRMKIKGDIIALVDRWMGETE